MKVWVLDDPLDTVRHLAVFSKLDVEFFSFHGSFSAFFDQRRIRESGSPINVVNTAALGTLTKT